MEDKDHIKELFREKLSGMESSVRPELWNGIASQIGATSAVAASGLSVLSKVIIGTSIAAAVAVSGYFILKTDEQKENEISTQSATLQTPEEKELQEPDQADTEIDGKPLAEKTVKRNGLSALLPLEETQQIIDQPIDKISPVIPPPPVKKPVPVLEESVQSTVVIPIADEQLFVTPVAKKEPIKLKLPNVFTPNGDGDNDELFIESAGLKEFNLVVLDLSNKTVYQTNDPDFRWNGMDLYGEMVKEGRYVYYMTALDANGNPVNQYSQLFIKTSR